MILLFLPSSLRDNTILFKILKWLFCHHPGSGRDSSGSPISWQGNLIWRTLISRPIFWQLSIVLEWSWALKGIVTMVVFRPPKAKSLAMFIDGMLWPWIIRGKKKMWSRLNFGLAIEFLWEITELWKNNGEQDEVYGGFMTLGFLIRL